MQEAKLIYEDGSEVAVGDIVTTVDGVEVRVEAINDFTHKVQLVPTCVDRFNQWDLASRIGATVTDAPPNSDGPAS